MMNAVIEKRKGICQGKIGMIARSKGTANLSLHAILSTGALVLAASLWTCTLS